jgi:hypothetical protein
MSHRKRVLGLPIGREQHESLAGGYVIVAALVGGGLFLVGRAVRTVGHLVRNATKAVAEVGDAAVHVADVGHAVTKG